MYCCCCYLTNNIDLPLWKAEWWCCWRNRCNGYNCVFIQERSNFPRIWFRDLKFRIWGLEIKHQKAHNFVWQGCFFFHYYLATSMTDWDKIFTGLLFYAYIEIHQVRRLVFDNYQTCTFPLTKGYLPLPNEEYRPSLMEGRMLVLLKQ